MANCPNQLNSFNPVLSAVVENDCRTDTHTRTFDMQPTDHDTSLCRPALQHNAETTAQINYLDIDDDDDRLVQITAVDVVPRDTASYCQGRWIDSSVSMLWIWVLSFEGLLANRKNCHRANSTALAFI